MSPGFFRVNYDNANWELIASQLQNDLSKVDLVTRAALVSDAFSMARSGRLDYSVALDLSTYLTNEVEYVPWEAALRHLSFLDTRLASTDAYNNFKVIQIKYSKSTVNVNDFYHISPQTNWLYKYLCMSAEIHGVPAEAVVRLRDLRSRR